MISVCVNKAMNKSALKSSKARLTFLYVVFLACIFSQTAYAFSEIPARAQADGLCQSIHNATLVASGKDVHATRTDTTTPVEMVFSTNLVVGVSRTQDQWWILPLSTLSTINSQVTANNAIWILPTDSHSKMQSWYLALHDGDASAIRTKTGVRILISSNHFTISKFEARPHSDVLRNTFALAIPDGARFEDALAGFYWGTMLPSVVEKTMAANFPYSSGYVLSTLKVSSYGGSYPAVDHEFQVKGRLAMSSDADLDVTRRMIELQFRLMNDDPEHLNRAPTSVQPNGTRQYHVRRNSLDNRENAAMFPLTANIEVLEESWNYYEARKDDVWLLSNIVNLEQAANWVLASVDQYGRVWSDVYYEDQVIKDGRETQAQAFAAHAFGLMAEMEMTLKRTEKSSYYAGVSKMMGAALIAPLPEGYWDEKKQRFIDWVDRNGQSHDHVHLLANTLPVLFGYATEAQALAVRHLVEVNSRQFERFPSFIAAEIADYNSSEIGSGGPYDLSAAGRYWYWDAAYRASLRDNRVLYSQLQAVAAEGSRNNYFMGERYDMDYVYYIDGKSSHGAEQYYEYPNVFAAVLISKFLGLTIPADADVSIAPHLSGYGSVEFTTPKYALRYTFNEKGFSLKNLSDKRRTFKVDLAWLGERTAPYRFRRESAADNSGGLPSTVVLSAHEEVRWIALH